MSQADDLRVESGEHYLNTNNDKRLVVVDIQDWSGIPVAIIQYEDGVCADEVIHTGGDLPGHYRPLPTGSKGPVISDACSAAGHNFGIQPQPTPPDRLICNRCDLSTTTLSVAGQSEIEIFKHISVRCYFCERVIESENGRIQKEGVYMCADCFDSKWDRFSRRPYVELKNHILTCQATGPAPPRDDSVDYSCGFVANATRKTTKQYLGDEYQNEGCEPVTPTPCPKCGDHIQLVSGSSRFGIQLQSILQVEADEVPDDPTMGEVFDSLGTEELVLDDSQLDRLAALMASARKDDHRQQKKMKRQQKREEAFLDRLPEIDWIDVGPVANAVDEHADDASVLGYKSFSRLKAEHEIGAAMGAGEEAVEDTDPDLDPHGHLPSMVVVNLVDPEDTPPENLVNALMEMGYSPLDGERGVDLGGNGWPVEATTNTRQHPAIGGYAFEQAEPIEDG